MGIFIPNTATINKSTDYACIIYIFGQESHFLLNVCGKELKSLEASYLSVAFGAGMTFKSTKLYCFQIVVVKFFQLSRGAKVHI